MTRTTRHIRGGFTLVEMLVVMGIIMFLVTIAVVAGGRFLTTGREKATQTTIKKVSELLHKRMDAFERWLQVQERASGLPNYVPLEYRNLQRPAALAMGRKHAFRRYFPQTFSEAGISGSGQANAQSAKVLYEFLINGETFGAEPVDADAFTSSELAVDSDGRPYFIDGWGNPLRFYRWPTRLIRPAPVGEEGDYQTIEDEGTSDAYYHFAINPEVVSARLLISSLPNAPHTRGTGVTMAVETDDPLSRDADDPLGRLRPTTSAQARNFEQRFHTPETWHVSLIVSAGPDRELGLYEPHDDIHRGRLAQPDRSDLGALARTDNITNLNLQAGGN